MNSESLAFMMLIKCMQAGKYEANLELKSEVKSSKPTNLIIHKPLLEHKE